MRPRDTTICGWGVVSVWEGGGAGGPPLPAVSSSFETIFVTVHDSVLKVILFRRNHGLELVVVSTCVGGGGSGGSGRCSGVGGGRRRVYAWCACLKLVYAERKKNDGGTSASNYGSG